jgi:hypothetical protein
MHHLATWPQLARTAVQLLGATQPFTISLHSTRRPALNQAQQSPMLYHCCSSGCPALNIPS